MGYVFQNPDHQIFAATVRDELAFGLRVQGAPAAVVEQQVAEALDLFGLAAHAAQPPASLGYGQRRLVALASILVTQPDILILDEPTDGLDARSQEEIMRVIQGFNEGGGTTLLITHDLIAGGALRPARGGPVSGARDLRRRAGGVVREETMSWPKQG